MTSIVRWLLWLMLAFSPMTALAQSYMTTVTAQVKDINGTLYNSCRYSATLVNLSDSTLTLGATALPDQFKQVTGTQCDANGNLRTKLVANTALIPNNSQWRFTICDNTGANCFNVQLAITGTIQDITTQVQAAAVILPVSNTTLLVGNNTFTGNNSFKNHDGVRNCAQFASLQACLDDAGNDGSVYFPEGTYTYSTALHPYRGQNWQCGGGDAKSQGGVIFNYTGTGWAAENANKATTILEFWKMKGNCTFQVTSSATGAVDLKSVDHADLDYFVTAPLTGSVIGVNFDGTIASYYNKVTMRMFGTDGSNYAANNSHKCVVMSNGANENQVYGTCTGIDYGFDIQSANNSRFDMTVDGWGTRCINLGNSAGAHHNLFLHNRCETYPASIVGKTSPAAVQFGAASTDNEVIYPFESLPTGATGVQDDSAGKNDIEGVLVTPASPVGNFYGYSFGKHSSGLSSRFAINKFPTNAFDLDVAGAVNVDGALTVGGDTTLRKTTDTQLNLFLRAGATANQARNVIWQDFNGNNVYGLIIGAANTSWQILDYAAGINRLSLLTSSTTRINSTATTAVVINGDPNAGTGGLQVASGGASPVVNFSVSGAGFTTMSGGGKIGANGTNIANMILGNGTLTYTAIAASSCQDQVLAITNASTSSSGVSVMPRGAIGANLMFGGAWVSSAGNVTVRVCNPTTGALTPATLTWGVTITQ